MISITTFIESVGAYTTTLPMDSIMHVFGMVFLAAGALFTLTSSVGIIRFPDMLTRMHAAGIADAMGAPLLILGTAILSWQHPQYALKLVILTAFTLITAPTACHALVQAVVGEHHPKESQLPTKKRGRGRPKGSKNKKVRKQ